MFLLWRLHLLTFTVGGAVGGNPPPHRLGLWTNNDPPSPLSLSPAGFPRRREPALLYGVCEWRLLPGTAPHRRVNRPPAQGLRYPQAPLTDPHTPSPPVYQPVCPTGSSSRPHPLPPGYCIVLGPAPPRFPAQANTNTRFCRFLLRQAHHKQLS